VEFAERFAYQGLASNLVTYLTDFLKEPTTTAVKNVNTWVGVSSLFPLLGGFIADSYLGRFNTILLSSLIYFVVNIFSYSTTLTMSFFFDEPHYVFTELLYIINQIHHLVNKFKMLIVSIKIIRRSNYTIYRCI
jgi:peptide/histidine transporter 3/4